MKASVHLRIADEVFLVVAMLHKENPEREDFSTREILERADSLRLNGEVRKGFATHVSSHCVANSKPNPDKERMLFATGHGRRRLLRKGDEVHHQRDGKIFPSLEDIDPVFHSIVIWAQQRFDSSGASRGRYDSLLALKGTGKHIWADEHADEYVARLRSDWE